MDRKIIDHKFESLRRCVERIISKQPFTVKKLQSDFDLQDILSVNLERSVQNAIDIAMIVLSELDSTVPNTMAEIFDELRRKKVIGAHLQKRMKKAVGFRNLLVHEYAEIDWKIVYLIVTKHLVDFRKYIGEIEGWLEKNS